MRRALASRVAQQVEDETAKPAAVAVILLDQPPGLEALFIKRAVRAGDPWSGQIAFPGGRRATADADLFATSVREAREETGIDLAGGERFGQLDDLRPRIPTLPPVLVRPFVFGLERRPALGKSDEVERAFWVPLTRFAEPGVRRDVTLTVQGAPRIVQAYDLGDDVLWGMTERILTPFLELIWNA